MKKRMNLWKRLGALLMAAVLVAGLCPMPVRAADTAGGTTDTVTPLELKLSRVDMQQMWNNSQSDSTQWNDTWGARPSTAPTNQYRYMAEVPNVKNAADIEFYWANDPADRKDEELYINENKNDYTVTVENVTYARCLFDSDDISVGVKIKCDGLTLKNVLNAQPGPAKADPVTWEGHTNDWKGSYKVGVPFTLGQYTLDGVSGLNGGVISATDTIVGSTHLTAGTGTNEYIPTQTTDTEITLIQREIQVGATTRDKEELKAAITYPAYNATFTINGKECKPGQTVYLTAAPNVKITIPKTCGVVDSQYLPSLGGAWTGTADGSGWETTVSAVSGDLTVGNEKLTVTVDDEKPGISNIDAYKTGDNTVVSFNYTVGASGLKTVEIDGQVITTTDYTDKDGKITATVPAGSDKVTVKLTNNAEVPVTGNATVKEDLHVSIATDGMGKTYPEDGTSLEDGTVYVSQNGSVIVTVTGATVSGDPELKSLTKNDGTNTIDILSELGTGSSVTYRMDDTGSLEGFTITAVDSLNRSKTTPRSPTYKLDNTPPSVDWGELETNASTTYLSPEQKYVEYKVTISDPLLKKATVKYIISGAEEAKTMAEGSNSPFEVTIRVENGKRLEQVTVFAEDQVGNKLEEQSIQPNIEVDCDPPKVKFGVSEEITGFKQVEGKYFAILKEPVQDDKAKDEITVEITATIEDANLNDDKLIAAGWIITDGAEGEISTATKTFSVTVKKHQTDELSMELPARDLAGNANETLLLRAPDGTSVQFTLDDQEGVLHASFGVDRRPPSSGKDATPPKVEFTPSYEGIALSDGRMLYSKDVSFDVTVTDASTGGADSGVAYVDWKLDGTNTEFLNVPPNTDGVQESYTIFAKIKQNQNGEPMKGETNDAVLLLTVRDNAENSYLYSYKFAMDNQGPRIEVSYDNNSAENDNFFKNDRKVTVTVDDINFDLAKTSVKIDGTNRTQELMKDQKVEWTFGGGEHTFDVMAKDLAGNSGTVTYVDGTVAPNSFTVDKQAPIVTVEKTTEDGTTRYPGKDVEYYNGEVTYNIQIQDSNLTNSVEEGQAQKIEVSYTLEGEEPVTVSLAGGLAYAREDDKDVYSYSFTLKNGDVLTDIAIVAIDNADNPAETVYTEGTSFDGMKYTGGVIVVDKTKPDVKVEKTVDSGKYVQTIERRDYYSGTVTYKVTVTDKFLDVSSTGYQASLVYTDQSGSKVTAELKLDQKNYGDEDTLTGSVVLEDGAMLTGMTLTICDAAGNTANPVKVTDPDPEVKTTFDSKGAEHTYTGNNVIVDTAPPTATLTVQSDEVESFYTYTKGDKSVAYVKLKYPTGTDKTTTGPVTVDFLLEITDKNISRTDGVAAYQIKDDNTGTWTDEIGINADEGKITYKKSLTVPVDRTDLIEFNLSVFDLAGHALQDVAVNPVNGTSPSKNPVTVDKEGKVTGTITLDRRQPTSSEDFDPPKITVTPKPAPEHTSSNGRDLYTGKMQYDLKATDGSDANWQRHAGLKSVNWSAEGLNDFIDYSPCDTVELSSGTYGINRSIVFEPGEGETNDAVLKIVATDNVGNEIMFTQNFAVDTLAPRISVRFDNNSVQNDKYFNADRIATIQVEDINFDPNATHIVTQVTPSAWEEVEPGVWVCTCAYTTDGEYTLEISADDLGGNHTPKDDVKCDDIAPWEFVIDKTAPVIDVRFDPDRPAGTDNENVSYYNRDTTATVTITEQNFREGDVRATFNSEHKLTPFMHNGKEHTASVTFNDGNRYQFSINYTDLAGNPAVPYNSPIFSVDSKAPTIEITTPGMTNEALNIVPGELELQFRINDAQQNLSGYDVTLYHMNNLFEERTVDGGFYDARIEDGGSTVYVTLRDLPREKANDGLYTVHITARDYAGNTVELEPPVVFSVNRFGSTFAMGSEYTVQFLTGDASGSVYRNAIDQPLVFQEINPNRVWNNEDKKGEGSTLTVMINGTSRLLVKDQDYTMTVEKNGEGDKTWYVYTYSINPAVFRDGNDLVNGRVTILVYGVDDAQNYNTNESNLFVSDDERFTGRIEFTLDTQAPVITTTGIESRKAYNAEFQQMEIYVSDATPYTLYAKLNGESLELKETSEGLATNAAWLAVAEEEGYYILNVPEMNSLLGSQNVELEAVDSAGNRASAEVEDFLVSSNFFVRLINNVFAMIALALGILVCIFLIIFLKKKKKEKEEVSA